ncbi:aquaporin-3-like isoform X1 [Lampetra fluviatilis]
MYQMRATATARRAQPRVQHLHPPPPSSPSSSSASSVSASRSAARTAKPADMPSHDGRFKQLERKLHVKNVMIREALAEFMGTFLLVLFGCGSVAQVELSDGTKGRFLTINLAFGFAVTMGAYCAAGVSGAHLNPAVSMALAVLGRFSWSKFPLYVTAQLLGAFMGAGTVFGLYYDAFMYVSKGNLTLQLAGVFATFPSPHLSIGNGFVDQLIGTAALLVCILAVIDKRNSPAPRGMQPFLIGLIVVLIGLSMGFNAGYAVNPARDLGPRIFTALAGWGWQVFSAGNYWSWVPVVAPMLGGVLGAFIYEIFIGLHLPEEPASSGPEPGTPRSHQELAKLQANMADAMC